MLLTSLAINFAWRSWSQSPADDDGAKSPPPTAARAYDRLRALVAADELSALAIEFPLELERELAPLKSPEEKEIEAMAELAILRPAEFSMQNPRSQPTMEGLLAKMEADGFEPQAATNQVTGLAGLTGFAGRAGAVSDPEAPQRQAEALAAMADLESQLLPPAMIPSEPPRARR
ncbi:MAG: hypothetical protein M5U12_11555 [Verrucomicrobia bacterium]|nr:hypothetical protein [Verrucomicrobiota bacterium]